MFIITLFNYLLNMSEQTPTTIEDCIKENVCTFVVTRKKFEDQKWYSFRESDNKNIGMCAVCAKNDFQDLLDAGMLMERQGKFFCDHAAEGGLKVPGGTTKRPVSRYIIPRFEEFVSDKVSRDFILDNSLEITKYTGEMENPLKHLIKRNDGTKQIVSSTIQVGKFHHSSFKSYVHLCWATHAGLVINPDIFWFIVSNQLAQWILSHPSSFSQIFTTDPSKKKELVFEVSNPDNLNIHFIVEGLKKVIPGTIDFNAEAIVNAFTPKLTTSTEMSREAVAASFCEAMEAYYAYFSTMCGISKVQVLGTPQDWNKLAEHAMMIAKIFNQQDNIDEYVNAAIDYLNVVKQRFEEITLMNPNTWKDFFEIVECGSGHVNINVGWMNELYSLNCPAEYIPLSNVFGVSIDKFKEGSKVKYVNIDTNTTFYKCYGVFESDYDEITKFLTPGFCKVIIKENND